MFTVKSLAETKQLIQEKFGHIRLGIDTVPLANSVGCYLACEIIAENFVPAFDRSTVDGFAVLSRDLQGCSETIPAVLKKVGEAAMGGVPTHKLTAGECFYVPTGGALPAGADAMVMIEFVEEFGANEYGFVKPVAPGANMIFRGEDLSPGELILPLGKALNAADIGTLAAMGITQVDCFALPRVSILSTGDELVNVEASLEAGKIRDVNTPMLAALLKQSGAQATTFPIVPDQKVLLEQAIREALVDADVLLVSGGTSVGEHDNLPTVIQELGEIFVHGIAIKPGKPTIVGQIDDKPVIGLPGNPVAAFFMYQILVKGLLAGLQAGRTSQVSTALSLSRAVPSNHGREEVILVRIEGGQAIPVPSKSGLISTVSAADGYILIPRDQEGLPKGAKVQAFLL